MEKKPCNILTPPPPFQTSTKNSDSCPFAHYDCVVLPPPHIYRYGFQAVVRTDPPTPTGLLLCVNVATVPANFYFLTFAILRNVLEHKESRICHLFRDRTDIGGSRGSLETCSPKVKFLSFSCPFLARILPNRCNSFIVQNQGLELQSQVWEILDQSLAGVGMDLAPTFGSATEWAQLFIDLWFSKLGQKNLAFQWRIQDFSEVGAPTLQSGGANIRFCQIFIKTAWKWKNLDTGEGARVQNFIM